jgi:uncharacterized protein (TIGR03435 family)
LIIRWLAFAQIASVPPEFDVASVKANHSDGTSASMQIAKGSLTIMGAPLQRIAGAAFGIGEDRIDYLLVVPEWMKSERYDISARFPADTTNEQVRVMLQKLLADRFGLKLHRETRELPVYALVIAKSGLKVPEAVAGAAGGFRRGVGHLDSKSASPGALADKISQLLDRPVMDMTGIRGVYAFALDWTPDEMQNKDRAGPSFFTAIEEQSGLKLEARKAPMEVVVVDYAEKIPVTN